MGKRKKEFVKYDFLDSFIKVRVLFKLLDDFDGLDLLKLCKVIFVVGFDFGFDIEFLLMKLIKLK